MFCSLGQDILKNCFPKSRFLNLFWFFFSYLNSQSFGVFVLHMQTHATKNEKINKPPAFNLGFFREQYILQILTTNSSSTTYNTYVHLPGNTL